MYTLWTKFTISVTLKQMTHRRGIVTVDAGQYIKVMLLPAKVETVAAANRTFTNTFHADSCRLARLSTQNAPSLHIIRLIRLAGHAARMGQVTNIYEVADHLGDKASMRG